MAGAETEPGPSSSAVELEVGSVNEVIPPLIKTIVMAYTVIIIIFFKISLKNWLKNDNILHHVIDFIILKMD